ncbi:MAG: metallophosphoesterase, partial [Bacteroidales bacterium]|nr:metallophosphoesterase [Bacteroidales bacterium]
FTGDLVNSRATELAPFLTALSQLQAPDGVYSVLGNHDYGTYARWSSPREQAANLDTLKRLERQLGWRLLLNEHHCLHRGSDSIVVAGVENSGRPPFPDRGDLRRALQGTNGRFRILLSHDPTHWRREVLPRTDVQLTLSGHTHDMQVSLFGFSVSRWIYPEHRGLYLEGGRALYVNIGLGYVLFPLRLGAWPEITVITLRTTPMNLSQKNQPK